MPVEEPESLSTIDLPLGLTYGFVVVVAGLVPSFNPPTDRGAYLPGCWAAPLPVPAPTLMMIAGCIEIVAGLAVIGRSWS